MLDELIKVFQEANKSIYLSIYLSVCLSVCLHKGFVITLFVLFFRLCKFPSVFLLSSYLMKNIFNVYLFYFSVCRQFLCLKMFLQRYAYYYTLQSMYFVLYLQNQRSLINEFVTSVRLSIHSCSTLNPYNSIIVSVRLVDAENLDRCLFRVSGLNLGHAKFITRIKCLNTTLY